MEIKVESAELRKRSIMVCTPMFAGLCNGTFTRSMQDLTALCIQYGVELKSYYLFNESLIQRARNYCCDEFLRSTCTHLMFIDADIGFNPNDVIALLALQDDASPYDIIGAAYPKKCISWEKIKLAVDKGRADENPNELEKYVGDYVFNPVIDPGQKEVQIRLDQPAEVLEIGTGFMMIRRSTFDIFKNAYPETAYLPDHVRTEHFDGSREINAYFEVYIDPKSRRLLSEDYMFCQKIRHAGGKVWLCPWMALSHTGSYTFGGSLTALASIQAHATADGVSLAKGKSTKSK
jgi:hypothetical protein